MIAYLFQVRKIRHREFREVEVSKVPELVSCGVQMCQWTFGPQNPHSPCAADTQDHESRLGVLPPPDGPA